MRDEALAHAGDAPALPRELVVRAPADGSLVGRAPVLDADAVRRLVVRARAAQHAWAALPARRRGALLLRFRERLAARADEAAELSSRETGKVVFEALMGDVLVTCDLARFYARAAPKLLRPRRVRSWIVSKRAYEVREPYGVVGVIAPWNFPVTNAMRATLAALAMGNTVALKPSELTPLSALLLRELADEAGIPDDVLLVATGDGGTGAALVEAGIDKLSFTGSVATGRRVAEAAARRLVPVTLELGGKDPMLVLADADLDRAVPAAAFGGFFNAGQLCASVERIYVEAPVYDTFVERLAERAASITSAAAGGAEPDMGALTTGAQLDRLDEHVADAVRQGARVVAGGRRGAGPGRFYEPTVLADAHHGMRVMREETFGPLVAVAKVADAEEALRMANDSSFGLHASVWTERRRGERLARRLRAGMVSVNDVVTHAGVAGLPFGGQGESGYGRVYGLEGLRELSRTRSLLVDRLGLRHEIWYYPLRSFGLARARALLALLHGPGPAARLRGLWRLVTGGR